MRCFLAIFKGEIFFANQRRIFCPREDYYYYYYYYYYYTLKCCFSYYARRGYGALSLFRRDNSPLSTQALFLCEQPEVARGGRFYYKLYSLFFFYFFYVFLLKERRKFLGDDEQIVRVPDVLAVHTTCRVFVVV